MIKFLYTNGDSFAFGQELDGPRTSERFYEFSEYQRRHCYSGIIADRLNLEYMNEALPGGSNQRIYRTTLSTISQLLETYKPNELFVLLSMTHANRREFYVTNRNNYYPHMSTSEPKDINGPTHNLWKLLTKEFEHEKSYYEFDQQNILGIQNFLRVNKIPYLMTWSMHHGLTYEDEKRLILESVLKQRYAQRFYQYPSFQEYVFTTLKLTKAPGGHPLADGHAAWANHLFDYIEKNNLFDNSDL